MRHPRFLARGPHYLLIVALILIAAAAVALSFFSSAGAQAKGKIVLAWHAGFASRWLDPQEHDGTATPDNFFTALHDGLIKNQGTALFDHPALAERFTVAADAKSATFTLRKGIKFHNGDPVTPQDVKWSYESYRGAKADVFKKKTERVEIVDDRTIRFVFKEPFLDFAILFGTANVAAPGWVVPEKYYKQVGPDGFKQKPVGAGPYKLVRHEPGVKVEMEAFDGYYRPVNVKQLVMVSVPEAATRVAMLERGNQSTNAIIADIRQPQKPRPIIARAMISDGRFVDAANRTLPAAATSSRLALTLRGPKRSSSRPSGIWNAANAKK